MLIKTVIDESDRKKQEEAKKKESTMGRLRKSFSKTRSFSGVFDDPDTSGDDLPGQANREGTHKRRPSWADDLSSSSSWSSSTVVSLHEQCWDDHEIVEDFLAWRWKNDPDVDGRLIPREAPSDLLDPRHSIRPPAPDHHGRSHFGSRERATVESQTRSHVVLVRSSRQYATVPCRS